MSLTHGTLLGGRVRYAQPANGFRSGIEPVLLAAAVPARPGDAVLEGGTGAGAALLCLATRVPGIHGAGVERDPALAALAKANIAENALAGLEVMAGAVEPLTLPAPVTHAFANPPYHQAMGTASADPVREAAKRAGPGTIATWVAALARNVAAGGTLSLILPPAAVPDALAALAVARCGGAALLPLWPKTGRAPKLVILQARKGGRTPFRLCPGLVLHREDGGFTDAAQAILREGAALEMR